MALVEFQILWLLVAFGGTGISRLYSIAPTSGTSASFSANIDALALRIAGAQVTRIKASDDMGFGLSDGLDSPCSGVGAISQHCFSRPETMAAQFLASRIIRQLHRPESACGRINLNMRSPLNGLFSRTIDHGRVHYADRPSTRCLRHLFR
jgi:hypothetical protein